MSGVNLEYQIAHLIALTPQFLVMVLGVVVALQRFPKHPRTSWRVLAALALDGMADFGLPIVMQTVAQLFFMNNPNPNQSQMAWMFFSTFPYGMINAAVWALVLFAVFDRPDPPRFLKEDDPDRDILDR